MTNANDLKAAGYLGPYPHHHGEYCTGLYQKDVRSEDRSSKLYFINVYLWKFPHPANQRASVEVTFYREVPGLPESFRIEMSLDAETGISSFEAFLHDVYQKMGCVPDLHNND